MAIEIADNDLVVPSEQPVDLIKITLDDLDPGDLLELAGRRAVAPGDVARRLALAVAADDLDVLGAKFPAQLVEIERHGESRPIADQQVAVAVVDVAARSGHEHPALVLEALAFLIVARVEQLPVGQAGRQHEQHRADQQLEKEESRALRLVGFDDAHGEKRLAGWNRPGASGSGWSRRDGRQGGMDSSRFRRSDGLRRRGQRAPVRTRAAGGPETRGRPRR